MKNILIIGNICFLLFFNYYYFYLLLFYSIVSFIEQIYIYLYNFNKTYYIGKYKKNIFCIIYISYRC